MPHLIKKSNKRLTICASEYELIDYEFPYFYNFPPRRNKSTFEMVKKDVTEERREDNVRRARKRLRQIITCNADKTKERLKFYTFTFKENIKDIKEANYMWSLFIKRFDYWLSLKGLNKSKYITVVEFQERGAVHYHTLFFNIPFINRANEVIADIWTNGFVFVIAIDHVNNIASYVSKYLQKGTLDTRLIGQKAFFGSRNLLKPILFRNEINISDKVALLENKIYEKEYNHSKYGKIKIQKFII